MLRWLLIFCALTAGYASAEESIFEEKSKKRTSAHHTSQRDLETYFYALLEEMRHNEVGDDWSVLTEENNLGISQESKKLSETHDKRIWQVLGIRG